MKTIRVRKFDRLIAEMNDEFSKGQIFQAVIESEGEVVEGLFEPATGNVYVDPIPVVVETLVHELMHRRYPDWTERRVSDTAHRLMTAMSIEERHSWYRAFRTKAHKAGRIVKVEA